MSAMSAEGARPIRAPRFDRRTVVILSIVAKLGSVIFVVSSLGTATLDIGVSVTVVVSGVPLAAPGKRGSAG